MTKEPALDRASDHVAGLAERLLQRADAAGVFPTPLDSVAEVVGIEEVLDISELPAAVKPRRPSFLRRVVGALLYREEVAFIDYGQSQVRARFTEAHEIAHRAIPWHQASHELFLDDDRALDPETELELEAEANIMAAHLLFQGARFHDRALSYELSLATPTLLAPQFGTSMHATIRYYVEHHPESVALAIVGQFATSDDTVPVWNALASPTFIAEHGPFSRWFPGNRLAIGSGADVRPLGQVAHRALHGESHPELELRRTALDGEVRRYKAEAFYNQRCVFVLVTPRSGLRLGRRVRLAG
ncbi:ImmA/IrrE family metallo-endopeptidase [Blastococcus sp. CT_GayMR20]|uniref:ImmA/IrrE family metallo-endopeptidase n=1 Tax=Blastococcus sp. CT_GayMR20 TaxID=2559609 RepID=UPI0014312671|nr:ImmA/IrrE family metallo-endopeptidase [Blastococcus sp. CT_GayMR20]